MSLAKRLENRKSLKERKYYTNEVKENDVGRKSY